MHRPLTVTLSAAAALALPVTALAHGGPGGNGGPHGKPADPGAQGQSHRCAKTHTVGFQLHGLFASYDGTTLTLSQVRGNAHAQSAISNGTAALVIGTAPTSFGNLADANADGTVGWDDVTTLDRVNVHGRTVMTKHGCPAADQTAPTIERVRVVVPDSTDTTQGTDSTGTSGATDSTGSSAR